MTTPLTTRTPTPRVTLAALALGALAAWRIPTVLGMSLDSSPFAGQALNIVLWAAFTLLLRSAFACTDRRLTRIAYAIGLVFSGFVVVGKPIEATHAYAPVTWAAVLDGLLMLALYGVMFGALLTLLYQGAEALTRRSPRDTAESLPSKLLGNPFAVFLLLVGCWVPVWLAFWPGTFLYDSGTQFFTYVDWVHNTHHPLLHTLLLGACMMLGIEASPDGAATEGLALYSGLQLALLAAMLAYACHWLRRVKAPLAARVFVTAFFALFPFFPLWTFSAQKDVLFGGLVLLFVLQLADVWRDGAAALRSPFRVAAFLLISTLMMLFRNNGIYALCLTLPVAILWAKGSRLRLTGLLAVAVALYYLANGALIWATEATVPGKIELLSIPLQQIARTLRDEPDAIALDTEDVLGTVYGGNPAEYYNPPVADPVKWGTDYDAVDENLPQLLSLWVRMGLAYPKPYAEAFVEQNLPYFLPGSPMLYRIDIGVIQMEMYPIEEHSYFPELRKAYEHYDQTLTFLGVPGVRLLSDTAFYVWLTLAALGLSIYRKERHWSVGLWFLLALWGTCLVGPIAIIRYMLGIFYTLPVLLAAMLAPRGTRAALPEALAPLPAGNAAP